jgi:hypothetical protein
MPADHTGLAARLGRLTATALAVLVLCLPARKALGQDVLEDLEETPRHYLLTLSGQVGKTSFQKVQAMLVLATSPTGSIHNYIVTIGGWPKSNAAASFVWNSEDSHMDSTYGRVTCRIANSFSRSPNIHFFYLSPVLLGREGMLTQNEGDLLRQERREVRPTMIQAQAGELVLTFTARQVSGQVWITGYDPVQKANIHYHATIHGALSGELKSTLRGGRFD